MNARCKRTARMIYLYNPHMISNSVSETIQVAKDLVASVLPKIEQGPVIIMLQGDYGTGKTQFVKGLAEALGIKQNVVSPSFVYMRNYPFQIGQSRGQLVHIDAWRVSQASDFKLLGVEQYLQPSYIIAIEWPQEYAQSLLDTLKATDVSYQLVTVSLNELEGDRREITVGGL